MEMSAWLIAAAVAVVVLVAIAVLLGRKLSRAPILIGRRGSMDVSATRAGAHVERPRPHLGKDDDPS